MVGIAEILRKLTDRRCYVGGEFFSTLNGKMGAITKVLFNEIRT